MVLSYFDTKTDSKIKDLDMFKLLYRLAEADAI
jgi:hypothetical protein